MTRDNKNDINKDLTIYGPASTVQIRKKYEADSHGEVAFYRYRRMQRNNTVCKLDH